VEEQASFLAVIEAANRNGVAALGPMDLVTLAAFL
jgi:hypothetical protein